MKTYGTIEFRKDRWVLDNIPPFVSIRLKANFQSLQKSNMSPFEFKDTLEIAKDIAWFISRYPVKYLDDSEQILKDKCKQYIIGQNELEEIFTGKKELINPKLKDEYSLRKYQKVAVNLWLKIDRLLLGDDVGLGKTLCAIGGAVAGKIPMLVVCQTHLPTQWERMIHMFTNLRTHKIMTGKHYSLPHVDIYITKYTMLSKWIDIFAEMNFSAIVFDEGQELRRDTSEKYKAAFNLSEIIESCMILTATPIYNYADEIYNVMKIVKSDLLSSRNEFNREWCGWNDRVKDPKALGTYLMDSYHFLRRNKKDVGMELDPVNKIVHTVGYDEKQLKIVEDRAKILATSLMRGSFIERGKAARDLDMMLRQATGIAKAKDVAAYARVFLENNIPIILCGWHRDVYDIWLKELEEFNPVMYTGTESIKQKDESVQKFTSGKTNLFIISLRSGIGLDGLQHMCSTMIFGELDWSPQVHYQLIGRIDRPGQKDKVTAIYLVSDSGSDPTLIDLLADKKSQSDGVTDPLKGVEIVHSDDSRIKELAKSFLKQRGIMIPEKPKFKLKLKEK